MDESKSYIHILPLPDIEFDVREYLRPAEVTRAIFEPHFYRCLPLSAVNSLGWTLFNPYEFSVVWTGGNDRDSIVIECDYPHWTRSWFGYGIFTIFPLFLIETSPMIDVWVRPVPNHYKLGVLPLEGIMETDWLKSSFTLNFKVMLPMVKLHYAVGEPLVNLIPYPRQLIEDMEARVVSEGEGYEVRMEQYKHWLSGRQSQIADKLPSELAYLRGTDLDGTSMPTHKKTFKVPPFKK